MSEMIERVARTLARDHGKQYEPFPRKIGNVVPSLDAYVDSVWKGFAPSARLAIAAMREPTQKQISAAIMSFPPWGGHGNGPPPSEADMWRAMIDAALKEGS